MADTGALSTGISAATVSGDCRARTMAALAPLKSSQYALFFVAHWTLNKEARRTLNALSGRSFPDGVA